MTEIQVQVDVFSTLARPPDEIPAAAKAEGMRLAKEAGRQALAQLEDEIGVPIPTSEEGAKRLARQEAEQIYYEAWAELDTGIPPIPLDISEDTLTVEGAYALAYDTGKVYLEEAIEGYTGFPVELPDRLTAKGVEQWADAMVPDDAAEAMEIALAIGMQYAASAITAALVGAGVGSVVPGIGTVVGIAVALGVNALREEFKEVPRWLKPCKTKIEPELPQLSPVDLMPWLAQRRMVMSNELTREQSKSYCDAGMLPMYVRFLTTLMGKIAPVAQGTARNDLGRYQLERLIRQYGSAPRSFYWFNRSTNQVELVQEDVFGPIRRTQGMMEARYAELVDLMSRAEQVEMLPAGAIGQLRFDLVSEIAKAGRQVAFTGGSQEALQWFQDLSRYRARLSAVEARMNEAIRELANREIQRNCKVEKRRDEFGEEQFVTICEPEEAEQLRQQFCEQLFSKWRADNPQYSDCVDASDTAAFCEPCKAWLEGKIEFQDGARFWMQYVAQIKRCGIRPPGAGAPRTPLAGFVTGFRSAGVPLKPAAAAGGFFGALNPLRFFTKRLS